MALPDPYGYAPQTGAAPAPTEERKPYMKIAMWIAIAALIAAALLCVVWVLVGTSQNGLIARAFLTLLLLAGFAGAALFDASQAPKRPQWYELASMIGWVLALIAGAFKIWLPEQNDWFDEPGMRFIQFVGIVLVLRLAVLHARLIIKTQENYRNSFTRIVVSVTVGLVAILAIMLILPLVTPATDFGEFYWRVVVAVTILAALGTALVPLVKALNAPRRRVEYPVAGVPSAPQAWPTYVDGVTPLPVMPDGSPDWNAYYTGYPTYAQPAPSYAPAALPEAAPAAPAPYEPTPYQPAPYQPAPSAYPPAGATPPAVPPVPPLPPL